MSAESLLPWRTLEKPIPVIARHDHRGIVMIAGEDPYACKGTEDDSFSHIRPDREGADASRQKQTPFWRIIHESCRF